MLNTKQLGEKINMFCNLLFHIDDYIENIIERKDQLHVSKNIRVVLKEVISSKKILNYFINKLELISEIKEKKSEEILKKEIEYIKKINPLSFNQKYLNNINLFYNSNNEMYVINYISVEKIFSIIRYCFIQVIKQKNILLKQKFEKENKNFVLNDNQDYKNYNNNNNEKYINNYTKNIINKILKNNNEKENINTRKIIKIDINKFKKDYNYNNSVNIFSILNNSYKFNNINYIINNNSINKNNNLKIQLNKINNQINISLIKNKNCNSIPKNTLKKTISLPLIKINKFSNHKSISYYSKENNKINEYKKLLENKNLVIGNNIQNNNTFNDNRILPIYRLVKIKNDNNRSNCD